MRILVLSAFAAVGLSACQPAAEPQPVDARAVPDASTAAPIEAAPAVMPEPTPAPPVATPAPAPTPRAAAPRPARPTPGAPPPPTPAPPGPPADPMAGHDMSKMDGMTMPPKQ
jgi:hypothetical protein